VETAVPASRPVLPHVAVLIPCLNEAASIGRVVRDFRSALPDASVHVCDNASTDDTAACALQAGAMVTREPRRGKGNVVRRMMADVDADVYVMVDGDGTYEASAAPPMVARLTHEQLDMVVATRQPIPDSGVVYRHGHATGNTAFSRALRNELGGSFTDVFSGYRVMSRRFVKSFPSHSTGFEIETELSAHAVDIGASCAEIPTAYGCRDDGSESKLNTYRDGFRILFHLIRLVESMRPLQFFTFWFLVLTAIALALGIPVVGEYERTGFVARFPTAFLAASLQVVAFLSLVSGVILNSVRVTRQEAKRLAYLALPPPPRPTPKAPESQPAKAPESQPDGRAEEATQAW
jgi:glycosyltransferase involved in cell wall biosynthesis